MSDPVTLARRGGDGPTTLVRPLGAFERLFYRASERFAMHFVLAAEFDTPLEARQVSAALAAVQGRHPLLSVHVEDHSETGLAFHRAASVPPIELTVLAQPEGKWQPVAARQLAHQLDPARGARMRAVLITEPQRSTLVLAFDHFVGDGMSAAIVLGDLVAALNGAQLEPLPVPSSQEELIAANLPSIEDVVPGMPSAGDPRMAARAAARPFDGVPPHVHTVALDKAATTRLLECCRAERTSVHAAIVAVSSRVRSVRRAEQFVRTLSPFNLRTLIGAGEDFANYVLSAHTGLAPWDGTSVWDQARAISHELARARSASGVVAGSAVLQQFVPVDADSDVAQELLTGGLSYELFITNLGVSTIDSDGPIRPRALWGPIALSPVKGAHSTGIITYDGQLRMATCASTPTDAYLSEVRTALLTAST